MKSSTIKKTVLAFGIVVLISNSAFAESQNRQQKTPSSFSPWRWSGIFWLIYTG